VFLSLKGDEEKMNNHQFRAIYEIAEIVDWFDFIKQSAREKRSFQTA
jgi:hypothetical protein